MTKPSARQLDLDEQAATPAPTASPLFVLALSVVGFSFAAPLIRLSHAAPLVIAAWRLGFSLVIVALALALTGTWRAWRGLARDDVALAGAAGILLALHFWSWNASLRYTTVAASVSLVNLQPAIVALVSARWLGERPSRTQWLGIGIAILGALVVGLADLPGGVGGVVSAMAGSGAGGRAVLGDLLAVVGALTATAYYLIGRRIRQRLALWPYVALVYGAAFVTLVVLSLATGAALAPQPPRELSIFAALAVGPMLLGHTGMNWALGHLPAFIVNLTVLGEPIGATLLAALIPGIGEVPGPGVLAGGAIVLAGVYLAARRPSA